MAEIDVVPKRRSSAWVWWVLAIVLIVLVVWMLAGNVPAATSGQWNPPFDLGDNIEGLKTV